MCDSARTYGKSDPIDALAVARAALREPDLPAARLDGPDREVRLLVDHREALVAERTRIVNRLRWHLHELDPSWDPPAAIAGPAQRLRQHRRRLAGFDGLVARLARDLLDAAAQLTTEINELDQRDLDRARRGAGADAAGRPRLRSADRGEDPRRDRRHRPFTLQGRLRPAQRHRPAAGLVVQPGPAPAAAAPATGSSTPPCTASP